MQGGHSLAGDHPAGRQFRTVQEPGQGMIPGRRQGGKNRPGQRTFTGKYQGSPGQAGQEDGRMGVSLQTHPQPARTRGDAEQADAGPTPAPTGQLGGQNGS